MRNLINYPPENYTFEGDPTACHLLLPLARQMVRRAWLANQQVCQMRLADGAYIRAELTNGLVRIMIHAGNPSLYLESGFYVFDTLSSSTPSKAVGATVYYNSAIIAIISGNEYPEQGNSAIYANSTEDKLLRGEKLDNGFRSKTFQTFTYDDYVLGQGSSYIDDILSGLFQSESGHDLAKYTAMTKVKPSVFPGKLQLFVQVMYSAKGRQIDYIGYESNYPILRWENQVLNPLNEYAASTGLLTTVQGDYILFQMGGGEATFTRLELSANGRLLKNALRNGAITEVERLKRVEAYILATATVLPDSEVKVTFTPAEGFVLYYGWHWNWDGTEGDAIKHEISIDGGNHATYIVRHERLTIDYAYDVGNDSYSFTVSSTIIETKTWFRPALWLSILVPFPFENKLINAMYDSLYLSNELGASIDGPEGLLSDIPVYCFRDSQDDLQVVRVSQDIENRNETVDETPNQWVHYPEDAWRNKVTTYSGHNGTVSINCGALTVDGELVTKTRNAWEWVEDTGYNAPSPANVGDKTPGEPFISNPHDVGGDVENYLNSLTYFAPSGIYPVFGQNSGNFHTMSNGAPKEGHYALRTGSGGQKVYYVNDNTPMTDRAYLGVIIPYDSCSSVLITKQQQYSERNYTYKTYVASAFNGVGGEIIERFLDSDGSTYIIVGVVSNISEMYWRGTGFLVESWDTSETLIEPESFAGKMGLVSPSVAEIVEEKQTDVYDYFTFSLLDPFVESPDLVKTSLTGGYRYMTGYTGWGTYGGNDYEGLVSVGWA